jgi:hypothetical protein
MSNTFWAVFFGSSVGLFTVNIVTTLVDEWQHRQRHKRVHDVLELLEDSEYEDYV